MSAHSSKETRETFVHRFNSPAKSSRPEQSENMWGGSKKAGNMGDSELQLKLKSSALNVSNARVEESLLAEPEVKHERNDAVNANKSMSAQVRALEVKVASGERKYAQLLDEYDDLWATRNTLQINGDIYARKEAKFFADSVAMKKDKLDLQEKNIALKQAKLKAEQEIANLKNSMSQLSAAMDRQMADNETLRFERDELYADRNSLTAAAVVIREERDKLAVMLTKSHANIKALKNDKDTAAWDHMAEMSALDEDKQKLEAENKKLKADEEQLQVEKEELKAKKRDLVFGKGNLLSCIGLTKEKEAETADKIKQMQRIVMIATPNGDGTPRPYTEPYHQGPTEFAMLDKELSSLGLVIERAAAEKNALLTERDELRATVNKSAKKLETLTSRLHFAAEDKQECQTRCLKMASTMEKAEADLASVTAEYDIVKKDRDSARSGEKAAYDLIKQRDAAIRVLCHDQGEARSAEKAVANTVSSLSAEKDAAITAMEHAISQEKIAWSFQRKILEDLDKANDIAREKEAVSRAKTSFYEANILALKQEMIEARHGFTEKVQKMSDKIVTISAAKMDVEAELKMYKEDGGVIAIDD